LSAFGGFFERGFRAHDYQLGRRNCQKFLRDYFRLSIDNPIVGAGLNRLDPATRATVVERFDPQRLNSIPIIPLCGSAVAEVPVPARATISAARVSHILDWIVARLRAVAKPLLESAIGPGWKDVAALSAVDILISTWGKAKLKELIEKELRDVISG
jgi:hypothetical protein